MGDTKERRRVAHTSTCMLNGPTFPTAFVLVLAFLATHNDTIYENCYRHRNRTTATSFHFCGRGIYVTVIIFTLKIL